MLALVPPAALWILAIVALAALVLGFILAANPNLIARGQDAAGKGMAAGCAMFLLTAFCAVLGLFTAGAAFLYGPSYPLPTRLAAFAPLTILAVIALTAWINLHLARLRSVREEYARRMSIPVYLVITDKPEEVSALYNALRTIDQSTETNVWEHPLALRHQFADHLPRARIIAIKAWTRPRAGESDQGNTSLLLARDLAEEAPVCPILLFGPDDADLDALEQTLAPKWTIHRLKISGDNWIAGQWLPLIRTLIPMSAVAQPPAAMSDETA